MPSDYMMIRFVPREYRVGADQPSMPPIVRYWKSHGNRRSGNRSIDLLIFGINQIIGHIAITIPLRCRDRNSRNVDISLRA